MSEIDAGKWDDIWSGHLESYLSVTPRTGLAIQALHPHFSNSLEIAAGSGRDSYHLYQNGTTVSLIDYAEKTIAKLKERFPSEMDIQARDAFALGYPDQQFDMTFHNGFYVLFRDDDDIRRLIIEQARVTRKKMIIIEHNALNRRMVNNFRRKAENDAIYAIRFFEPQELVDLVESSGINVGRCRLQKFGGWPDRLYMLSTIIPLKPFKSLINWMVPRLYRFLPWCSTERIMLSVDLLESPM